MYVDDGHSSALLCSFDTIRADPRRSHRAAMKIAYGTEVTRVTASAKIPGSISLIDLGYAGTLDASPMTRMIALL